jgi:DNA (cytosine-5)-methyltransferase 1
VSSLTAVDLFSGAGGTTQGLRDAGYEVAVAIECDPDAAETFASNHSDTLLLDRDIRRVQAPALNRKLAKSGRTLELMSACPPCQPFSTLGSGDADDPRNRLVSSVLRFARALRPRAVLIENVPGLRREPRFRQLLADLGRDYRVASYVVEAADFGVPQRRRRVIALGVRRDLPVRLPSDLLGALPPDFDASPRTAGQALAEAAHLTLEEDSVHRARVPQSTTLKRIRAAKQGGGRFDLPVDLQLDCHARLGARHATSIYGRIDPAEPAPTMTTRCTTPSCGRFVHPTEDRGLTLREAALLQTFPLTYSFLGSHGAIERQIGNAVPPRLAEALGVIVATLLTSEEPGSVEPIRQAA